MLLDILQLFVGQMDKDKYHVFSNPQGKVFLMFLTIMTVLPVLLGTVGFSCGDGLDDLDRGHRLILEHGLQL